MDSIIQDMINEHSLKAGIIDKRVVHEVLQQVVLAGLYRAGFFDKAVFYGGTCLRIFYGLERFSEDLDFSLYEPDSDFDLSIYFDSILMELSAFGCDAQIRKKKKTSMTNVESAFLKSDTSIYNIETDMNGKITIKIEVDTNPPKGFQSEPLSLVTPFTFLTPCYTLPNLYAGKMHALLYRKWQKRVKGRDWFDFSWYVRKGIKINLDHFNSRAMQTNPEIKQPFSKESFLEAVRETIRNTNITSAKEEVLPFLKDSNAIIDWSQDFFMIQCEHIKFN